MDVCVQILLIYQIFWYILFANPLCQAAAHTCTCSPSTDMYDLNQILKDRLICEATAEF